MLNFDFLKMNLRLVSPPYFVHDFFVQIYLTFLIKTSSYMNKNSEQKLKYLTNEKSCEGERKSIFHHS